MDLRSTYNAIRCEILSASEIRCSNGLILTPMDAVYVEQHATKSTGTEGLIPTNCVNCGAVINLNVDQCEYCGTSYSLMGVPCAPKKVSKRELLTRHAKLNAERRARLERDQLQLETELLQAKTKVLSDAVEIKTLYEDALNAMRSYGRDY